jgi:hypothetical protein
MAQEKAKKPSKKITDEEILKTLREAVLKSIKSPEKVKDTIKSIDSTEKLSDELKDIGKRLVQKKARRKKGVKSNTSPTLTVTDLRKLETLTISSSPKKTHKGIKRSKKKPPVVKVESTISTRTPVQTEKPKLLRAPSLLERLKVSLSFKKLLLLLFLFIIIVFGVILYLFYKTDTDYRIVDYVAQKSNFSVAKVNGEVISYRDFKDDTDALSSFFSDETNAENFQLSGNSGPPNNNSIKPLVLERTIRTLLIRQALERYNQTITDVELQTQLDEIIRASGGTQALEDIVADLYSWSTDEFVNKALLPLIEEEKLTIFISQEPTLNSSKEDVINMIATDIANGLGFAQAAQQFSQDISSENGGDLDWFSQGTMVKEFEDKVFQLEIDQVSQPFKSTFGWHIVKLTDKDETDPENTLYKASHILIGYITLAEFLAKERDQANISIYIPIETTL